MVVTSENLTKELVADIKAMVAQWHYNKNETYTQTEILALIRDAISSLKLVEVVSSLPTTNIKNNILYLVVNHKSIVENAFDIYLYVNNAWEQIDKLEFEIANYYNKSEVDVLLGTKSDINHGHDVVTTSTDGFMSASDKTKLNGIATGATKNTVENNLTSTSTTNALSAAQGKVLKTAIDAKSTVSVSPTKTSGVEIGRITVDGTEKILYQQDNNTTYSDATTSSSGLMSSTDKSKLDGIAEGANNYTHPNYTARTGKPTANQTPSFGGTATVSQITSDATGHVTGATDRTIKIPNNLGNGTTAGLSTNDYTTAEKNKLEGIDSGANKITVDSSLSTTSTNPVQNKIINNALESLRSDMEDITANESIELQSYAKKSELSTVATSGSYNDLADKPSTFTPSSHAHGNITNAGAVGSAANKPLITGTNGVVQAGSFEATATNIKMNGTQGVGSLNTFARSDHVHPTDTSRAASSHSHGNIQNDGVLKVSGTAQASKSVCTDASGNITAENKNNHAHGSLASGGTLNSDITSVNKVAVTDSSNNLKTISKVPFANLNITKDNITGLGIPASDTDTTYSAVTQSANGLMTSADKQKVDKSMTIGFGSLAGTTNAFTVSITGVTLTHGTIIACYNAVGDNAASATLNVNNLGAKPIYYNASAISDSRFPNKSTALLMYNTTIVSTGCWQMIYSYDSNSTYTKAANTPVADTVSGTVGTVNKYALEDHAHPQSSLYAEANHTHDTLNIQTITATSGDALSNHTTVGWYKIISASNLTDAPESVTYAYLENKNYSNVTFIQVFYTLVKNTVTNIYYRQKYTGGNFTAWNKLATSTDLSGKANSSHNHTKSEITDFPTSMTPSSHVHGNITNAGAIGSTANLPIITTTSGKLTTGSFGTAANTFCQGNDSRLSDSRTPTSHSHGSLANGGTLNSDISSVNKVAVTDSSNNLKTISKVPFANLNITKDNITGLGIPASDTNTTYSAGTGLSLSSTTFNHSNSVAALTTSALKKIKYDAQGHITGTDTVSASDLPSHTHTNLARTRALAPSTNTDDADLNTVTEPGWYNYTLANAKTSIIANIPVEDVAAMVEVKQQAGTASYLTQIVYTTPKNTTLSEIYYRKRYDSYWSDWQKLITSTDSRLSDARTPLTNSIEASSTNLLDLNDYQTTGFYYCNSNSKASYTSNVPESGKSFFLLVESWGTDNYIKQTCTHRASGKTYVRIGNNGTWGSWIRIATENDLTSKADAAHTHDLSGITDFVNIKSWQQTTYGNYTYVWYNEYLDLVMIRIYGTDFGVSASNVNKWLQLTTIDAAYRPTTNIALNGFVMGTNTQNGNIYGYVGSDGKVMYNMSITSGEVLLTGMYPRQITE